MNRRADIIENLKYISSHWGWYFFLGVVLVVGGFLAMTASVFTTLLSVVLLGSLLVFNGVLEAVFSFKFKNWGTFFLHLFLAVLYVSAGIFMIYDPIPNAISLTLLIAAFFVASGLYRIYFAVTSNINNKSWILLNGVLTLLLGLLVWYQWPVSGLWVLGLFVGIDMIFSGWSWIVLATQAKCLLSELQKQTATKYDTPKPVKHDFKNLINACNESILASQSCIKNCTNCQDPEDCAVACQRVIEACIKTRHQCSALLEDNKYENEKQKDALINLEKISKECEDRCNIALQKILDKVENACEWPVDICDTCIKAADHCIESFTSN